MELWQDNGGLVEEKTWKERIDDLKSGEISDKEQLKKEIKEKLFSAVEKRWPKHRFGIFFSGGVDSSAIALVAKKLGYDFTCYAVGFQEGTKVPDDVLEAKKVAAKFNFDLKFKIFDLKEAEQIIKKTVRILKKVGKTDVVNAGVGAVVLAAIEMGLEDNVKIFMGGLGSEEIFAGYERHAGVADIQAECWRGLRDVIWSRDLIRDFNLAKNLKVEIRTPFLDGDLIKVAMQVPAKWKVSGGQKKVILREVAEGIGLGEAAWRKKKAAQYGSCFDKAIGKLAKKNGFKLKKDYLNSL